MYCVLDIGGTFIKYGYYNANGVSIYRHKVPTIKTNLNDFYQNIISLIPKHCQGIAISMPGLVDHTTGDIHNITNLPFLNGRNIIKDLQKNYTFSITVENDAKCAALGEMWKGSLQNVQNGLMIVFGTGIGGTIIINGQLMESPHNKAGEIGSILMPLDNDYQNMTNFGSNNNANKLIQNISKQCHCENDGLIVFQEIKKQSEAFQIFEKYCRQIAFMIYNLDYILDLDCVCIGGGISEQDILIQTIQEQFQQLRNQYKEDEHQPCIKACQFNNEANLLGALYHHIQITNKNSIPSVNLMK